MFEKMSNEDFISYVMKSYSSLDYDNKYVEFELRIRLAKPDMLEVMIGMQDSLNNKVGVGYDAVKLMCISDQQHWMRRYARAAIVELSEYLEECGSRWWKTLPFNKDKAIEESIDVWHFLMSMWLMMGMTAKDVYDSYIQKNAKNFTRMDWDKNKVGEKDDDTKDSVHPR